MKKLNNSKKLSLRNGITLIALIITIIVLLILVGITLNLTLGERGIFRTTEYAGKNYINAQNKELADIEDLYSSMLIATGDDSKITISTEDLNTLINNAVDSKLSSSNTNSTYTTTEQIVGKWIDGKPIYRQIFTNLSVTPLSVQWITTSIEIPNVDVVINGGLAQNGGSFLNSFFIEVKNEHVKIYSPLSTSYTFNTLFIEYTKTTDTATNN